MLMAFGGLQTSGGEVTYFHPKVQKSKLFLPAAQIR